MMKMTTRRMKMKCDIVMLSKSREIVKYIMIYETHNHIST